MHRAPPLTRSYLMALLRVDCLSGSAPRRFIRIPVMIVALAALCLGACRRDVPDQCRIDYELVAGEPSDRYDILHVAQGGDVVVRQVFEDGAAAPVRAIYYYFEGPGNPVIEALDEGARGDIEARLDAQPMLGGLILPYAVDTNVQEEGIDTFQFSMELPSSMIGPYNPARIFFQLPCDLSTVEMEELGDRRLRLSFVTDLLGEEEVVAKMVVATGAQNQPLEWTVDTNGDGEPNDVATIRYNELGLVREVIWARTGLSFGNMYVRSRFIYDSDGNLYRYETDATGSGTFDHAITYSSGCYRGAFAAARDAQRTAHVLRAGPERLVEVGP